MMRWMSAQSDRSALARKPDRRIGGGRQPAHLFSKSLPNTAAASEIDQVGEPFA